MVQSREMVAQCKRRMFYNAMVQSREMVAQCKRRMFYNAMVQSREMVAQCKRRMFYNAMVQSREMVAQCKRRMFYNAMVQSREMVAQCKRRMFYNAMVQSREMVALCKRRMFYNAMIQSREMVALCKRRMFYNAMVQKPTTEPTIACFVEEGISYAHAQVLQAAERLVYASLVLRRNIVSGNVFDEAHMSVTLTCVEPIKHSNRARYTVNICGDDANPIYCNFIVDQINNVSLEQYEEAVFSVATLESWCVIQTTTTKGRSTVYCRPNQELLHH